MIPQPAQRGGSAKSSAQRAAVRTNSVTIRRLSPAIRHRTSAGVPELFDMKLRALRRDRAFRRGAELFLHERAFDDCLARLALMQLRFDSALLIGCPDPGWVSRLGAFADKIHVFDPGPCFAEAAGGATIIEDRFDAETARYGLCVAIGTLDTVNDLPQALARILLSLSPDALFLGALAGGDTVPQLRSAMRAA